MKRKVQDTELDERNENQDPNSYQDYIINGVRTGAGVEVTAAVVTPYIAPMNASYSDDIDDPELVEIEHNYRLFGNVNADENVIFGVFLQENPDSVYNAFDAIWRINYSQRMMGGQEIREVGVAALLTSRGDWVGLVINLHNSEHIEINYIYDSVVHQDGGALAWATNLMNMLLDTGIDTDLSHNFIEESTQNNLNTIAYYIRDVIEEVRSDNILAPDNMANFHISAEPHNQVNVSYNGEGGDGAIASLRVDSFAYYIRDIIEGIRSENIIASSNIDNSHIPVEQHNQVNASCNGEGGAGTIANLGVAFSSVTDSSL